MPQLTRQELYDLVWSMPMKDAAASVSMSHGGLSRICHRHGVPVPPRAYWPGLKAGRPLPKVPLPARDKAPRIDLQGTSKKPRAELLEGRARAIAALRQTASSRKATQAEVKRVRMAQTDARRQQLEAGANDELELRRRALLRQQADLYDEAEYLGRFVRHLRHSSSAHRSERLLEFLTWAEAHVESLRDACSTAATEERLGAHDRDVSIVTDPQAVPAK